MIRPLRQRHRRMFAVLGVILPVAFVVGISARKPVPASTSLQDRTFRSSEKFSITQWSRDDLFAKTPVRVASLRDGSEALRLAVDLSAAKDFVKPDLLVYWIAGNAPSSDGGIPDNAVLLGSFNGHTPLPIPRSAAQSNGVLMLYSLADDEIVDVSKPITW
jgi:hypothetical protein